MWSKGGKIVRVNMVSNQTFKKCSSLGMDLIHPGLWDRLISELKKVLPLSMTN